MDDTKPQGQLVIQISAMPKDTNAHGDIFGGWLVAHMDMGAGIAGRDRAKSRVVTVAIDGLVFKRKVSVGDTVSCYADITHVGRTSMTINMQVWAKSIGNDEFQHAAGGIFTFVAIDSQGRPQPVDR